MDARFAKRQKLGLLPDRARPAPTRARLTRLKFRWHGPCAVAGMTPISLLANRFVAYRMALESVMAVGKCVGGWRGESDLANQCKRAAQSVMLNLGEGSAYPIGSASQQRFFRIARASAIEVECALECAMALGFCDAATLDARARAGRAARLANSVCR